MTMNTAIDKMKSDLNDAVAAAIAALPVASPDMVAELCAAKRGFVTVKTDWLKKTHRLDDDGALRVAIAKAEHELACNALPVSDGIKDMVENAKRFTSFKYAVTGRGVKFKVAGIATAVPSFV